MYVVKRLLSINGHIYHPLSELLSMLRYVLGSQAEFYYIWLVLEGYVVNVSEKMVGESGAWVAWRGNLLGEVRFAWRVVEHCHNGGKMEILCGEPGTGKTQKLAERLAAEKGNALGGSAQHDSAKLLTERLKALECEHTVGTVHRGYKVMKMLRGGDTKAMHRNLYYADELGQLACDAAGAMAMRWKLGSEVLFSIGGGQNLPVGAGRAGEDLMDWLKMNPSKLPSCKLNVLTDNHRTKNDPNARGIVEAFRAIARGDLPKEGPGMILVYCYDASEVIDKAVSIAKKSGALCLVPTRSTADDVNCGFIALDRYDPDLDFTDLSYHKDEKLVVQHAGERTLMLGLRTGDEVKRVCRTSVISQTPKGASKEELKDLDRRLLRAAADLQKLLKVASMLGWVHGNTPTRHIHLIFSNSNGRRTLDLRPKFLKEIQGMAWTMEFLSGRGRGKRKALPMYPQSKKLDVRVLAIALFDSNGKLRKDRWAKLVQAGKVSDFRQRNDGSLISFKFQGRRIRLSTLKDFLVCLSGQPLPAGEGNSGIKYMTTIIKLPARRQLGQPVASV
jgi:hypothetical protein